MLFLFVLTRLLLDFAMTHKFAGKARAAEIIYCQYFRNNLFLIDTDSFDAVYIGLCDNEPTNTRNSNIHEIYSL